MPTRPPAAAGLRRGLIALVGALAGCGDPAPGETAATTSAPDHVQLVQSYFAAANAHDLLAIQGYFAEDAEWRLFGDRLRGRRAILGPHEQDLSLETRLTPTIEAARGDTVWVHVIERNRFLRAFGLPSIEHRIRVVVRDSVIQWMGPAGAPLPASVQQLLAPFFEWVRTERPEAWAQLVDRDGTTRYSLDNGNLLVRLAEEWRLAR